jgi:hypothetical protein
MTVAVGIGGVTACRFDSRKLSLDHADLSLLHNITSNTFNGNSTAQIIEQITSKTASYLNDQPGCTNG